MQAATERIHFQYNSKLASRTVELCQSALNHINSTKPKNDDGSVKAMTVDRQTQITQYLYKDFAPSLVKIASDELNLTISRIDFSTKNDFDASICCMFANIRGSQSVINKKVFSGTSTRVEEYNSSRRLFSSFTNSVDLKVGKLSHKTDLYTVYPVLSYSLFAADEIFTNCESFTAQEIASIILHEFGHGLTLMEHCTDTYYRFDLIADSIRQLSVAKDSDADKIITIDEIKLLRKEFGSGMSSGSQKQADQLIKDLEEGKGPSAFGRAVLTVMYGGLLALRWTCLPLMWMGLNILSNTVNDILINGNNESGVKTSDTRVTSSNQANVERIADEFVSRHGLGGAFASAQARMAIHPLETTDRTNTAHMNRDLIYGSYVVNTFKSIDYAFTSGWNFIGGIIGDYDQNLTRIEQLFQNNMTIFKDIDLPQDVREHYIADTKAITAAIQRYKSKAAIRISENVWGTIFRIMERYNPIDTVLTANLSSDYDILQRLTCGLVRNPFYFHAARIKSLMSRKE